MRDKTLDMPYWVCGWCFLGVFQFLRSLRRLNASVETVSGAILAVSTVQSANFTISHFCRVWKKVVFSVKSWGTRKLYHVQEHTFGYLLVFFYRFSSKIEVFSLFWNPWWQNSNENPKTPKKTITKSPRRKSAISQKVAKQVGEIINFARFLCTLESFGHKFFFSSSYPSSHSPSYPL